MFINQSGLHIHQESLIFRLLHTHTPLHHQLQLGLGVLDLVLGLHVQHVRRILPVDLQDDVTGLKGRLLRLAAPVDLTERRAQRYDTGDEQHLAPRRAGSRSAIRVRQQRCLDANASMLLSGVNVLLMREDHKARCRWCTRSTFLYT